MSPFLKAFGYTFGATFGITSGIILGFILPVTFNEQMQKKLSNPSSPEHPLHVPQSVD